MRTIQDVGTEILSNNPKNFYIFGGSEYGIKRKYLSILHDYYGSSQECRSLDELLNSMSVHHFIPLEPTLYIVRYDEEFVSNLSESINDRIKSINIVGTIVCIYESDKHVNKLAKYLPDYVVKIDAVSDSHMIKYLKSDYPNLPDRFINLIVSHSYNYNDAYNICKSMSRIEPERWFGFSDKQILYMFGKQNISSDDSIRKGIAAKNFKFLVNALETYTGDYDKILYTILSTMLELEKSICSKFSSSDLKEFTKNWMDSDIYNLFMITYNEIGKLRTYATDVKSSILYLFCFLNFKHIPSVEYLESEE